MTRQQAAALVVANAIISALISLLVVANMEAAQVRPLSEGLMHQPAQPSSLVQQCIAAAARMRRI
jgi:hypothetical protein